MILRVGRPPRATLAPYTSLFRPLGGLADDDADGAPDVCDTACQATGMSEGLDDDNDGVLDVGDLLPSLALGGLADNDADGAPDVCDTACQATGMSEDLDDDNDGVLDVDELFPTIDLGGLADNDADGAPDVCDTACQRSEEHTSELQSRRRPVCRVLLETKDIRSR